MISRQSRVGVFSLVSFAFTLVVFCTLYEEPIHRGSFSRASGAMFFVAFGSADFCFCGAGTRHTFTRLDATFDCIGGSGLVNRNLFSVQTCPSLHLHLVTTRRIPHLRTDGTWTNSGPYHRVPRPRSFRRRGTEGFRSFRGAHSLSHSPAVARAGTLQWRCGCFGKLAWLGGKTLWD
ncbi:hypothetical protein P171DRAFT_227495 [Karstenula rhodostoma CBS 690.94]|uniref:Uncharacterized protein n=1 Tax=Karstenula rhodostoma CBS 690.94 TaxID=1392251 RepID=A0A9P4PRI7_9PLEO|nr:hypothetical protein P171DRAFT_227495 [Karstenula rhodostoma CBS 690.94]